MRCEIKVRPPTSPFAARLLARHQPPAYGSILSDETIVLTEYEAREVCLFTCTCQAAAGESWGLGSFLGAVYRIRLVGLSVLVGQVILCFVLLVGVAWGKVGMIGGDFGEGEALLWGLNKDGRSQDIHDKG